MLECAKAHGLDPLQLSLIWTFAAGGKLFAFQSAVLVVGYFPLAAHPDALIQS